MTARDSYAAGWFALRTPRSASAGNVLLTDDGASCMLAVHQPRLKQGRLSPPLLAHDGLRRPPLARAPRLRFDGAAGQQWKRTYGR